jgi:hypothetical protein
MESELIIFINQIATYFESHTKPVNTFCGQNTDYLNADEVVHRITTNFKKT